ncbi:hypothetical protein EGR_10673 [Echinococcus granulosus]|uniref:Uncharacterized protein n=1 Tax=Echinococcus granulosus TaxID=6210 RepID=W6ULW9_ECHGR|nr:hypothetical protein EGR_10673 [Echinococcus granulosus]EUB54474.1 hypothetical protein EGR_10673 [Echinococcus granulosus]
MAGNKGIKSDPANIYCKHSAAMGHVIVQRLLAYFPCLLHRRKQSPSVVDEVHGVLSPPPSLPPN